MALLHMERLRTIHSHGSLLRYSDHVHLARASTAAVACASTHVYAAVISATSEALSPMSATAWASISLGPPRALQKSSTYRPEMAAFPSPVVPKKYSSTNHDTKLCPPIDTFAALKSNTYSPQGTPPQSHAGASQ